MAADLSAGSRGQGAKRKLDWQGALALSLTVRTRMLAGFPVDPKVLFGSVLEKLQELGSEVDDFSLLIDHTEEKIRIVRHEDVSEVLHLDGSVLTGGPTTLLSIGHICTKLAPVLGKIRI